MCDLAERSKMEGQQVLQLLVLTICLLTNGIYGRNSSNPIPFSAIVNRLSAKSVPKDVMGIAATVLQGAELMGGMLDDFMLSMKAFTALNDTSFAPESVQCIWYTDIKHAPDGMQASSGCRFNPVFTRNSKFPLATMPIEQ